MNVVNPTRPIIEQIISTCWLVFVFLLVIMTVVNLIFFLEKETFINFKVIHQDETSF